jgi:TatD DNase family protein
MLDAHAHLTDPRFSSDLELVLERARAAGVTRILTCGEDLGSSEAAVALAERYPAVRVAVGVHPHRAATWSEDAAMRLLELARHERVVAIGEIGMDLSGRSAPVEDQERALRAQLAVASLLEVPVVLHVRDAGARVRAIVDELAPPAETSADAVALSGMVHCYSEGSVEVAEWLRRGLVLSFAGTVTYPKSVALREAAAAVAEDRLLVETDAPYLAPQAHRGSRNEPAYVAETLRAIAGIRGVSAQTLGAAVDATARRVFGDRWGT